MSGIQSRGRRGSTVVPNWRWEDPTLDPYELRIAGWLASHADSWCAEHVTRNEIAQRLGISAGKVSKAMSTLTAAGIVTLESAPNQKGGAGIDRWVVIFDFDAWENRSRGDRTTGHEVTMNRSRGDQYHRTPEEDHSDAHANAHPFDTHFDLFWSSYPKKVDKARAYSAWKRLMKEGVEYDAIRDGEDLWCAYWKQRGEPEFIPYPATWLNNRRWETPPQALNGKKQAEDYYDPDTGAWMAAETRPNWR